MLLRSGVFLLLTLTSEAHAKATTIRRHADGPVGIRETDPGNAAEVLAEFRGREKTVNSSERLMRTTTTAMAAESKRSFLRRRTQQETERWTPGDRDWFVPHHRDDIADMPSGFLRHHRSREVLARKVRDWFAAFESEGRNGQNPFRSLWKRQYVWGEDPYDVENEDYRYHLVKKRQWSRPNVVPKVQHVPVVDDNDDDDDENVPLDSYEAIHDRFPKACVYYESSISHWGLRYPPFRPDVPPGGWEMDILDANDDRYSVPRFFYDKIMSGAFGTERGNVSIYIFESLGDRWGYVGWRAGYIIEKAPSPLHIDPY
ncbi:MAG: hypothetical protein M1837_002509 [Sclerophora amabilis]|nr:MAG: hypothetical protein M1837_002509 [Sclerophora amabilis]